MCPHERWHVCTSLSPPQLPEIKPATGHLPFREVRRYHPQHKGKEPPNRQGLAWPRLTNYPPSGLCIRYSEHVEGAP